MGMGSGGGAPPGEERGRMRLITVDLPGDGIAGADMEAGRKVGVDGDGILAGPGQDGYLSGVLGRCFFFCRFALLFCQLTLALRFLGITFLSLIILFLDGLNIYKSEHRF